MKKILIEGGNLLTGTIPISGAKNSAVALIPASLLSDEVTEILNVPNISDRDVLVEILRLLECEVEQKENTLIVNSNNVQNKVIPEELAKKLRASYYFMGALLGKFKHVEMNYPGGCSIGARLIDLHLKGFESLGATVETDGDKFIIHADELKGAKIYLDFASVGATINIMLAAVRAEGTTVINNAAREPEIVNIASFLNNMGARVIGAGTSKITIEGVDSMHSAMIEVIPDRIETATYIILGALAGKDLVVDRIIPEHQEFLLNKLEEAGCDFELDATSIKLNKVDDLKPIHIKTLVYPGFPTDAAQPITVLLTQASGTSILEETIYDNRMGHTPHLNNLGANINVEDNSIAYIDGPTKLFGTKVVATDLRAGAAMVIAGLIAEGTTEIEGVEHILRGYEDITEKLTSVGAKITLMDIE